MCAPLQAIKLQELKFQMAVRDQIIFEQRAVITNLWKIINRSGIGQVRKGSDVFSYLSMFTKKQSYLLDINQSLRSSAVCHWDCFGLNQGISYPVTHFPSNLCAKRGTSHAAGSMKSGPS
jgi:hypothetical protein